VSLIVLDSTSSLMSNVNLEGCSLSWVTMGYSVSITVTEPPLPRVPDLPMMACAILGLASLTTTSGEIWGFGSLSISPFLIPWKLFAYQASPYPISYALFVSKTEPGARWLDKIAAPPSLSLQLWFYRPIGFAGRRPVVQTRANLMSRCPLGTFAFFL